MFAGKIQTNFNTSSIFGIITCWPGTVTQVIKNEISSIRYLSTSMPRITLSGPYIKDCSVGPRSTYRGSCAPEHFSNLYEDFTILYIQYLFIFRQQCWFVSRAPIIGLNFANQCLNIETGSISFIF